MLFTLGFKQLVLLISLGFVLQHGSTEQSCIPKLFHKKSYLTKFLGSDSLPRIRRDHSVKGRSQMQQWNHPVCFPSQFICEESSVRYHCVRTLTCEDTKLRTVKLNVLLHNAKNST